MFSRLRTARLQIPLSSLDPTSPEQHQLKVALRSLSGAVFPGHKYDGKFVPLAVTGPWLIKFTVINHS